MENLKEKDAKYIAHTYSRFPLEIVKGKGSLVYDEKGKEYIDLTSGIGVTAFGMSDDQWVEAVVNQLGKFQHTSNIYFTAPCVEVAKLLCEKTGMKKVFLGNSGAEANECAIKVARKYAAEKKGKDCYNVLTLKNSFHGRTLTTLAATGQEHYHELFNPLTPGFVYAEGGNLENVKKVAKENNVAAIMIECIQGEGGVIAFEEGFIKGINDFCKDEDIVFIVDEVQTGNGRTGEFYAYMNYSVNPDIVSTAKGLGGGLPIGACLLGEKVQNVLNPGDHGSTYGGNPVSCAGALSVLSRIDETLLSNVKEKGKFIKEKLEGKTGIESISGLGLMVGIKTTKPAGEIAKALIAKGILVLTAKDKIRLLPALNISKDLLEKALDIIIEECAI